MHVQLPIVVDGVQNVYGPSNQVGLVFCQNFGIVGESGWEDSLLLCVYFLESDYSVGEV